jgi:hypothetical protein
MDCGVAATIDSCAALIRSLIALNRKYGLMNGTLLCRRRPKADAPSSCAASYCSTGTSCNPARKMTIQPPTPHMQPDDALNREE